MYFYRQQRINSFFFREKKPRTKSFCHLEFFFTVDLFHHRRYREYKRKIHVKYEMKKKCTAYVRVDGFRSHHHQHVIFWAVRLFKVRFSPTQFACSSNCTTRMVWIKNNKCIFSPYFFAIKNVFYFLLIVVASFLLFLFFSLSFRWVSSLRIITTTTTTKRE